jgi:hypothetical protein
LSSQSLSSDLTEIRLDGLKFSLCFNEKFEFFLFLNSFFHRPNQRFWEFSKEKIVPLGCLTGKDLTCISSGNYGDISDKLLNNI